MNSWLSEIEKGEMLYVADKIEHSEPVRTWLSLVDLTETNRVRRLVGQLANQLRDAFVYDWQQALTDAWRTLYANGNVLIVQKITKLNKQGKQR